MAGNVDGHHTPSPVASPSGYNYQPFYWGNQVNQVQAQLYRSVSENQAISTPTRQHEKQLYGKWRAALRCKQHVGTKEWINCKQASCVHLRGELHHLLECPYRMIGGCKKRCIALREELKKFRELTPKYPTVSDEQLRTRSRQRSFSSREFTANDELQAKLQALTIEEYVTFSPFSPSSPLLEEPLPSLIEINDNEDESEDTLEPVVELVPLDQAQLSVSNGYFRKGREWQKLCFLGSGTFGSTYLCVDKLRDTYFAIKKLPVSSFQDDEVKIWQKLCAQQHPNILNLYGAVKRKKHVLIFMEYMNGGSVGDYLATNGPLSERNALHILQQVLSGLNHMHGLSIIHGDIKAANILMDDLCLYIKLADFGSCVDLNSLETSGPSRLAGTLAFMAPEVCRSEIPSPSSDIWSAMCLLIQMLSAEAPWDEYRHQGDALLFVIGSAKRPPKLPQCSELVQEIFAQGLNVTASQRPTASQLLRDRVFDFDSDDDSYNGITGETDSQLEEETFSLSDDSTADYHSLNSLETSGEYFSTEDDFDGSDANSQKKAKPLITKDVRRIDSRGGLLKITNAQVTIPAKALQSNTTLAISSIDPGQFYQCIIDNGIQDKVTILGNAYKLLPPGLNFHENVSVKVTLPEGLHQSEDLRIFHGTFNESNKISWNDIEKLSPVLTFEDSAIVNVTIHHFSILLFVKSLPSFVYEYISTYFNYCPALFRFIVLNRREINNPKRSVIRIVIVRDSFYLSKSEEIFQNHYICHKLIAKGFSEMFGSRREYVCPKENFEVSIEEIGDSFCPPKRHTVQNVFGGEEAAIWEVDTCSEIGPVFGTVKLRRNAGQVYRFQFWEHEPTKYVKDVLKLSTLRYSNMLPLARALGLNQGEMNDLVEKTGGDEEKQLQEITEHWKANAENNALPQMEKFVSSVPLEAIMVSKRGKSHLSHLSEFRQKWSEHINSERAPLGDELHLRTMAKNGENVCQSVFSDCLFQVDHSEQAVCWAARRLELSNVIKKVLDGVTKDYSQPVLIKLSTLVQELISYDQDKTCTLRCKQFCEHLFDCIPWLMQVVKDYFKVQAIAQPSGLWGVQSEVVPSDEEQEDKAISRVWCDISELLKKLCELNSSINDASELEIMDKKADVSSFLDRISITDKEWLCHAARIRYYHLFAKEIMKSELSRTHSQDLTNLFQCLRGYASFCPTRLVHFSFPTETVQKESLSFNQSSSIFTQKCKVVVEDSALNLLIKVDVYIKGFRLSAELDLKVNKCDRPGETHGECTTLLVEYHHQSNENGLLTITNDCNSLRRVETVTVRVEAEEETVTDGNSNVLIKEGCPESKELHEIAGKVTEEWKPLGRILLSSNENEVNVIDVDRHGVKEKTIAMFEKWKQSRGREATYKILYDALVDDTVERTDIAENYCVVRSQRDAN